MFHLFESQQERKNRLAAETMKKSLAQLDGQRDAQTQLAVRIINESDDPQKLDKLSGGALFKAFCADAAAMNVKARYEKDMQVGPTEEIVAYQQAYVKIVKPYDFSQSSQKKFTDTLDKSLKKEILHEEAWAKTIANHKLDYLDKKAFEFLETYDPYHLLHQNDRYKDDRILFGNIRPLKSFAESSASSDSEAIFINFRAIVITPDKTCDYEKNRKFFNSCNMKEKKFNVDRSSETNLDQHEMYDHSAPHEKIHSAIGRLATSLEIITHELFHIIQARCARLFEKNPQAAFKYFGFTADDYKLYLASDAAYPHTDDDLSEAAYNSSKMEICANRHEENMARFFNSPLDRFRLDY